MIAGLATLLGPLLLGAAILRLTFPQEWNALRSITKNTWWRDRNPARIVLAIFLGTAAGIGASSCLHFLLLVTAGPNRLATILLEIALAGVLFVVPFHFLSAPATTPSPTPTPLPTPATTPTATLAPAPTAATRAPGALQNIRTVLAIAFAVLFSQFLFALTSLLLLAPMGRWDALPIWNLHARMLYRGGEQWTATFDPALAFSHPDYPLLLPGYIARTWLLLGHETPLAPSFLAAFFTAGCVVLIAASLALARGWLPALIAATLLAGIPYFVTLGSSQMADVPFAFFLLASLTCIAMGRVAPAALFAAFAAWTKNEGLLFLVVLVAARAAALLFAGKRDELRRDARLFLASAAPVLLCIAIFKLGYAPENDIVKGQGAGTFAKLADLARWQTIATTGGSLARTFGGARLHPILPLAACAAALGFRRIRREPAVTTALFAVALMFAGYVGVYLTTPQDLVWHLSTSVHRLLSQLWPSLLLAVFLCLKNGEEES